MCYRFVSVVVQSGVDVGGWVAMVDVGCMLRMWGWILRVLMLVYWGGERPPVGLSY